MSLDSYVDLFQSPGGSMVLLAMEVVAFPEHGMEAVRKITVDHFPAFILVHNKASQH